MILVTRQWVFVESGPGMFDAVPVRVGGRCDSLLPVISGLEVNQRVVTAGAFLLDAETRLSPNVAASYFGAGSVDDPTKQRSVTATSDEDSGPDVGQMGIGVADLSRIRRQAVCPVTNFPLGSMGAPTRVRVGQNVVYLCCEGCMNSVRGGIDLGSSAKAIPPEEPRALLPTAEQGEARSVETPSDSQDDRP